MNEKYFDWNDEKNEWLKKNRDIGFEDVVAAIEGDRILDILSHHNQKRYGNQNIIVFEKEDYAYLTPFIEDEEKMFFKTVIPSRKATKKYLKK